MLSDQRKRKGYKRRTAKTFRTAEQAAQAVLLNMPKQNTLVQDRLIETAGRLCTDDQDVTFQHSVLCQTCLPYRNPGDDIRVWDRLNGAAHLKILAGEAMHPELGRLVSVGLPFGPKPRMVLAHLNTEALKSNSPEIEIETTLTAFVKRLGLADQGRNMRTIKDQLARLSASTVRMGLIKDGRALTVNSQIVSSFELWPCDDLDHGDDPGQILIQAFRHLRTIAVFPR